MKHFLTPEDEAAVVAAIRDVETRTSAEIRVCVTYRWVFRIEARAWKVFARLGMANTRERNGVLIFMVPRRRRFVVIGDQGADSRAPAGFWKSVADIMSERLRTEDKASAIVAGIRMIGEPLAAAWPPHADNPDELSNDIARD